MRLSGGELAVVFAARALLAGCGSDSSADPAGHLGPQRILVANDNGIDDTGIVELARALARTGEFQVIVVASRQVLSGTSNGMPATRSGRFRVQRRDLGLDIEAYAWANPSTASFLPWQARCPNNRPIWRRGR